MAGAARSLLKRREPLLLAAVLHVSRSLALSVVAVLIGAGLGACLVADWAIEGAPAQCVASQPVATLPTWTPVLVVNSPYGGSANGTWTYWANTSSQTVEIQQSIGARNGSIDLLLEQLNWTVWTTKRVGDPTRSCAGVFDYSWTKYGGWDLASTGVNYTNDSQAVQYTGGGGPLNYSSPWSGAPARVLFFNDSFYGPDEVFSNCASSTAGMSAHSTYIDYRIPFEFQGTAHLASITFDELTNYTYTFPAHGGAWEVDDLSNTGGPGGGYSFSYLRGCD